MINSYSIIHVSTVLLKIFLTICTALFQFSIPHLLLNNFPSAQLVYRFLVSLLIIWIFFSKTVLLHFSELKITFLHSNLPITFLTSLALPSKKERSLSINFLSTESDWIPFAPILHATMHDQYHHTQHLYDHKLYLVWTCHVDNYSPTQWFLISHCYQ